MSFGKFDKNSNTSPVSEINTTPLVDIMLVLLIIFIVTAPLITNTVSINLPNVNSVATKEKSVKLNIALNEKGELFFNNKKISYEDLSLLLKSEVDKNHNIEMRLQADKNSLYQNIAEIMTLANKAGITKIGFVSNVK